MYLAKLQIRGKTHYVIRQSYRDQGCFKSRDLFDLGCDPTRFVHYPGGNSYHYDAQVEAAIHKQDVEIAPEDLDRIFFDFLQPEIQRVITGFDRGFRNRPDRRAAGGFKDHPPLHLFDKRRYHYLRFGHSNQRYIRKVPDQIFRFLQNRSRDELEHYFEGEERRLGHHALGPYMATIFQIAAFDPRPETGHPLLPRLDRYFVDHLCRLNSDENFLAGVRPPKGLYPHLIRYVLLWFDFEPARPGAAQQYIRDFINRRRAYRPPAKTAVKIKAAEKLFKHDWKTLKQMDGPNLTRIFRRQALKHHPDQGGNAETFRRLTHYYEILMQKKSL